jgi:hypothetical protein
MGLLLLSSLLINTADARITITTITMMAPRYTSDIDAARLTVVRSLENIQKALPDNRRRSTQSISAALAFELGGNNSGSSTVVTPISRRGQIVAKDDDDAWKKHLRPSEIMALEDQLEVLQQDIRDLNNIHARHVQSSRQQWRYAQAEEEQASQRHKLRRVGEAAVLPQVNCQQSTSPPSSSSPDVRIPTADKDTRLLYPSSSSSNGKTQKQQQKNQSAMDRRPPMQRPVSSRDIRPVNTKTNLHSGSHLSKAATGPRYQATTPEVISPTSSANVSSSLVEEVQHYNQYNARTANRRSIAGESSIGSESSHGNRRSSMSTGVRRRSIGERKVRFVEESIRGFQEQTKGVARETDNSRVQNSLSRSSSSSSLSSCSSISRDVTSSWGENNPGLFDTHSLSTDGDGESSSRASTSSRNQIDDTPAESQSTVEPQTHGSIEVEKATMTESTRDLIVRFFSRKSRGKGSTSSRGSTSSSGQSTSSKWGSSSSRSTVSKQINPPVSGPIVAVNGVKSSAFSSFPNPARSNLNSTSRPRENSATSTPIRSLLRKHSVSLLNKFTGKDGKATVTPLGVVSEGALAQTGPTCVVCLEEFDRNSVIQIPAECLHSYCKGCLKSTFYIYRFPRESYYASRKEMAYIVRVWAGV